MRKLVIVFLLIAAAVVVSCGGSETEPGVVDPTVAITSTSLPAPVVTIEATNTFIPIIEAQPSPTASATSTLTPTAEPTPQSPVMSIALQPVIAQGLDRPTFLTHAFDDRLFVLEQVGRIRIIESGELLPQPFLDITDRVGAAASEQGLLGLAFHPNYTAPVQTGAGHFYVNYTDKNGNTHISRFSVNNDDPYQADPESEIDYLTVSQPYPDHNGGSLAFGPDGYLYAGLGDGGSANDPLDAGQDLTNLLGKVLRLDVDSADGAYTIPPDNPFAGVTDARPEVWAYGLRNPWRFSFDRAIGDLYIADVGQNQWEEVDFQAATSAGGENYGWRIMEASQCFEADACDQEGLVLPIFEYDHTQGCSITGGYVYRGQSYPEMAGNYFVADYCQGTIWRLFPEDGRWLSSLVLDSDLIISSFGEDANGEIYALNYGSGGVYQLTPGN